jgi:hypothetical protein
LLRCAQYAKYSPAWGVIGYNVLPNLDYREENGSSSAVLRMAPSPAIFDSELNLSKPSQFMQSNADIFEEVKKKLKKASHASKSADLSLVIEHEGKRDYSLDSFIDDYVHPIMDFCHPDEGTICNWQVRPEPGFDMADEMTPFRPVKIKLYVQYR